MQFNESNSKGKSFNLHERLIVVIFFNMFIRDDMDNTVSQ